MEPNRREKVLVTSSHCVLLLLLVSSAANCDAANPATNPYQVISVRNLFALRPSPPPLQPQPPSKPLPTIFLTGITTILGDKRACLELIIPPRPHEPGHSQSSLLKEGQRIGPLEVLQIDPKAELVKVSCDGVITMLSFEKNGRPPATINPQPPRLPVATFYKQPAARFVFRPASR
jgi:hypothetical protein